MKLFSYVSAKHIQETRGESHKHRYAYYYGFQVVYGGINKLLLLVLIGILLGILPELLIVTLSFVVLRVWAGGLHFDSYTKCAWISLFSLTLMGIFSNLTTVDYVTAWIIWLTVLIVFIIYAPVEHKNKPLKERDKPKYKIISIAFLALLIGIYHLTLMNAINYGILLAGLITLPIVNKLEKIKFKL